MKRLLKDVVVQQRSSLKLSDVTESGKYPVFGAAGLVGYRNTYQTDLPSVAIIKDGAGIGRVSLLPKNSSVLGTMQMLTPNVDVDNVFLYYYLTHLHLGKSFTGSTIPHIYFKNYGASSFPNFKHDEQVRIAIDLTNISNAIENKHVQLNMLDGLVKSRFNEMFGDVLTNDKGYKTCAFGEYVIQMNIGPFGSAMKNDVFVPKNKGYCMVYEQKHAIDKDMNVSARYVDEATYKALKRFEVGPGDIIVSCRGTIGECFLIPEGSPNGIIHPSLMMIKPKSEVNHKFLVFLLERILAEQTQDGSGVKMAIKAKDLSKIQTIHPSRELQDSFISFVELIDKSRFIVQSQIKDLQELLDSKMDEYFGGDEE